MRSSWVQLTLAVLLVVALAARLYQIDSLSNQFHIVRQLYTAQMVRGQYFSASPAIPEWRREIALLNQPPGLEPPVIQTVALVGDMLVGSENLWVPRVFSAVVWVIGGWFIFLLAKKLMREEAALIASAFYLLTPYGIEASRSFQANPAMVAAIVMSWYAIVNYIERPTMRRLILAGLATALANFILIYAAILIFPLYIWLAVRKDGFRQALFNRNNWIYAFLALLPSGIYYFNGFFVTGFLRSQTGALFNARLWFSPDYWINWLGRTGIVIGFIPLILSIQALLTTRKTLLAHTLRGLWLSYFLYGFLINWPISSHNYYSMPIIPVAALSLATTADFVLSRLRSPRNQRWGVAAVLAVVAFIGLDGLARYLPGTVVTAKQVQDVRNAEAIGTLLDHSPDVIFLTSDYGSLLRYYGEMAGYSWPNQWDAYADFVAGRPEHTPETLFESRLAEHPYHYFVVTAFDEWELQPELKLYLETRYPVFAQTEAYLIYDLNGSNTG